MMPETKAAKMLNKFYTDPDGDKLASNRYQLEKEPIFFKFHFLNHAPGIVERYKCLPWGNASLFKHTIHTYMPAQGSDDKNNPANTHALNFRCAKNTIINRLINIYANNVLKCLTDKLSASSLLRKAQQ